MNAIAATGISSEGVKAEFEQHAKEEQGHMKMVVERINQLGGTPKFSPEGLLTRSAPQYTEGKNLVEMTRENPISERIACERHPVDEGRHSGKRRRACQRHARSAGVA
jgi:bacterioferritin